MSRATSSRWCPTPEQVMILEELYRAGIRAPNVTQIQKITCHLSYHGKIEGKNVFYWFQNHKAREKQKLRKKFKKQYCRSTQVQLISSTSCQILHGLGRSTSGLHEAPFCTCTSSSSVDGFLNRQGDEQMPKWAMNNCRWSKYGDEPSSNQMVRADGKVAVSNAGASATPHPPTPCFTKSPPPLRTLQLFPVKAATHLRQESNQLVNM